MIPEELESIEWCRTVVLGGNSPYALLLRYFLSAVLNVMFLLFSKPGQVLVFNNNNPFSLRIVNFCNRFLKRKVIIVCHGEMEMLLPNRQRGKLTTVLARLIRGFFLTQKIDDNLIFIVLGESILENLNGFLARDTFRHFRKVDHPYIYGKNDAVDAHGDQLHLGFVGCFSYEKGGATFLELTRELKDYKKIVLSVIGEVSYGLKELMEGGGRIV